VGDEVLVAWRDRLTAQLAPEGALETIGVYAHRLHMSPTEFAASLHDPVWMAEQVFTVVPIAEVQARLDTAVLSGLDIMTSYFNLDDA